MSTLTQRAHAVMSKPMKMSFATGYTLFPYQQEPFEAIRNSIRHNLGHTIVIVISRQAGKDELLAHVKVFYLSAARRHDLEIVEFNPTYKPQTIRAIDRLDAGKFDADQAGQGLLAAGAKLVKSCHGGRV